MMTEIVAFTLGFLCASVLIMARSVRKTAGVGAEELPQLPVRLFRSSPDNEKARRFATVQYAREKEEAITRGEGYPE